MLEGTCQRPWLSSRPDVVVAESRREAEDGMRAALLDSKKKLGDGLTGEGESWRIQLF